MNPILFLIISVVQRYGVIHICDDIHDHSSMQIYDGMPAGVS